MAEQNKTKRKLPKGIFYDKGAYHILYYVEGKRYRKRIGPNLRQAEAVLGKKRTEIREGRFFEKPQRVTTTFDQLASAYLSYARQNKRSWNRDETSILKLSEVFRGKKLTDITPAAVEHYKTQRMASTTMYGRPPAPATVNRELACLKHMFSVARKGLIHLPGGAPNENPVSSVKFLDEHNILDRVLTAEEFRRMVNLSPDYLKPIVLCAYYTGMRKAEILGLTWGRVDLKAGFIRLREVDTKTGERRSIPIGRELRDVLQSLPLALDSHGNRVPYVFTRNGQRIRSIREIFSRVCREAGLADVVFHTLRHTATTNLRRAGVDALTAMKITGHKTMAVFKRYNTIDEPDLSAAQERVDAYINTTAEKTAIEHFSMRGTKA
jgi:integrase